MQNTLITSEIDTKTLDTGIQLFKPAFPTLTERKELDRKLNCLGLEKLNLS